MELTLMGVMGLVALSEMGTHYLNNGRSTQAYRA